MPRAQLPQANALGAVNMNLARAVGPALGGALVAAAGAGWVFTLNAVSFVVVALAVASWRRDVQPDPVGREPLVAALRSGARYVRFAPSMRRVLARNLLFVPAASALWALLPVVATGQLGLGSSGYGVLLGALGVGAVAGAVVLPPLRARLGTEALLAAGFLTYAGALAALALLRTPLLAVPVLALSGAAWMGVLSSLNATAQQVLPSWVRARALSYYLVAFMAGQGLGALLWGTLAERIGVADTLLVAGAALALAAVAARWVPLVDPARLDPTVSEHWAEVAFPEPEPQAGPVLITVEYEVAAEAQADFLAATGALQRSRRRTGASGWQIYRDAATPERFVETFLVPTWGEHARQHSGRLTGFDRAAEERVTALAVGPPVVRHLLAATRSRPVRPRPRLRRGSTRT